MVIMKIHTLQIQLTTDELKRLKKIKGKLSWREFLLSMIPKE